MLICIIVIKLRDFSKAVRCIQNVEQKRVVFAGIHNPPGAGEKVSGMYRESVGFCGHL